MTKREEFNHCHPLDIKITNTENVRLEETEGYAAYGEL